jgi:hypothetical protein
LRLAFVKVLCYETLSVGQNSVGLAYVCPWCCRRCADAAGFVVDVFSEAFAVYAVILEVKNAKL